MCFPGPPPAGGCAAARLDACGSPVRLPRRRELCGLNTVSRQNTGRINTRAQRLQEMLLFATSLEGSERDAYIDRQTDGDPDLRRELLEWMARDSGGHSRSISLVSGALVQVIGHQAQSAPRSGDRQLQAGVGPRSRRRRHCLSRRASGQPIFGASRRQVVDLTAVENLGLRFRAERQILASLNHPNIARLLDAGEIRRVVSRTLSWSMCRARRWIATAMPNGWICERVSHLFLDICAAVQYAHQNLIVHRDLKPANILVNCRGCAQSCSISASPSCSIPAMRAKLPRSRA